MNYFNGHIKSINFTHDGKLVKSLLVEQIGKRLKKLREHKGYTQKQVAELIGTSASTYRDWEYGKAIQGEPYTALAEVFEVSLVELMTGKKSTGTSEFLKALSQLEDDVKNLRRIASSI